MGDTIRVGNWDTTKRSIEVEEIDRTSYGDYVKRGWLLDRSDLAERKRDRDDNWGINPDPSDSGFAEWSRQHGGGQ